LNSLSSSDYGQTGFTYSVFGLLFRSNLPIPGLLPAELSRRHDIQINLGSVPAGPANTHEKLRYATAYTDEAGEPALRIWEAEHGKFLHMAYYDRTEFWLDRDVQTVWARWSGKSSLENTLSYFVGPVIGLLLRLRGVVCLHGSVVAINERGVIFVGPAGAGKSTTAAAFARRGFAVLSDDIAALHEEDNKFFVQPGYPRVNLWPNSVKMLYGSADSLPRILSQWDKRCLALGQDNETRFEERTLPIGPIYVLGDPTVESDRTVESMTQKTAILALIANTYAANFLDSQQRADEFATLSRLVATVAVRKINPRRGALHVEELCDAILRDVETFG
jgi:hypothetical protein